MLSRWTWRTEAALSVICGVLVLFAPEWFVGRVVVPELRWILLGAWLCRAAAAWASSRRCNTGSCSALALMQLAFVLLATASLTGALLAIHVLVGGLLFSHTSRQLWRMRPAS